MTAAVWDHVNSTTRNNIHKMHQYEFFNLQLDRPLSDITIENRQ